MLRVLGVRSFARTSLLSPSRNTLLSRTMSSAPSKIQEIPDLAQFNKFIASGEKLTVIDFYATWCGPCKALEPIFELLAERVPEVQFGRVDVDQAQDVSTEYGISSMPTIIYFKNGAKVDTVIGANPPKIVQLISQHSGVDVASR
ncbi:hypothetical protein G9P44_001606 [Scheffersomyces stipitis]|nr:hypothetical protein G9P44_001606 [Scheffersomyces stipitis]